MPSSNHNHNTIRPGGRQHPHDYYTRLKRWSGDLAYAQYLRWRASGDDRLLRSADRIAHCSDWWTGYQCPDCGAYTNMITYGCHHRLCPICSVRRSRATAAQALQAVGLMVAMLDGQAHDMHLLTLTQRNCAAEDLTAEIAALLGAWSALRHRRIIRNDLIGWARTVEITRSEDGRTYHPHIHVMLVTRHGSDLGATSMWRDLWRSVMALDYEPICDCRPITDISAVYEVSKYVTKLSRMYDQSTGDLYDEVCAIDAAVYGRRLRSYGGLWARARKLARMVDADDMSDAQLAAAADGIDHPPADCVCGAHLVPVTLMWAGMDYKHIIGGSAIWA